MLVADVAGLLRPNNQVLVAWPQQARVGSGMVERLLELSTPSPALSQTSPALPGSIPS